MTPCFVANQHNDVKSEKDYLGKQVGSKSLPPLNSSETVSVVESNKAKTHEIETMTNIQGPPEYIKTPESKSTCPTELRRPQSIVRIDLSTKSSLRPAAQLVKPESNLDAIKRNEKELVECNKLLS